MIFINIQNTNKENYIFGNTINKDYLTKNYINVPLKARSKLKSTTTEYCDNFISLIKNKNFDIVEIHNRPLVFTYLKKKLIKNLYCIFIMTQFL